MTKYVWRPFLQRGDNSQVAPDDGVHLSACDPPSSVAEEQGLAASAELPVAYLHVVEQSAPQLLPEGNDALLVPLARHLQLPGCKIDIGIIQSRQFRAAESSLIEE